MPKGSSGELIAAENGPPEYGCLDPLRNPSPVRRALQISFHQQSLECRALWTEKVGRIFALKTLVI